MPRLIPRELLFGNPEKAGPQISPDGERLSYVAPLDGVLNVWVSDLRGDNARPITSSKDAPIETYRWAPGGKHILYLQDQSGNERYHCYLVDVETGSAKDLTPFEGVQARILATSARVPGRVLIGLNRDQPQLHDAYLVDLTTGELDLVAENPGFGTVFGDWVADADLQPRAGLRQTDDGGIEVHVRDYVDEQWRLLYRVGLEDSLNFWVVGFTGDGKGLYVASSVGSDTSKLIEIDFGTGEERVIFGDDEYDLFLFPEIGVRQHPTSRELQLACVFKDRLEINALSPELNKDLKRLRAADPGDFSVLGSDDADRKWLVGFARDDGPTLYAMYDRSSGRIDKLFEDRPALRNYELAHTDPFSFKSRDGLTVHGYLTFPPGAERQNLPTVLSVHGGPWARDYWGFNSRNQLLANRGYLCVQVNYRGSTGYGKSFVNASNREWAGRMHDDLLDALEYVGSHGYTDLTRVGIFGASYGGYAALVGATFTPDVFTCAVDMVGPSSLITLIENIPPWWKPWEKVWHERVGHPERDRDFLWSRSPLSKVDQIRIPMLIAQGANDPRVTKVESDQIVEAMKERNIPHKYLVFEDEGHSISKPQNALKFNAEAERFLAEHLGGRYES
jgi:dipeptidyl aminopeptidase/acylaminoacyl peptidase